MQQFVFGYIYIYLDIFLCVQCVLFAYLAELIKFNLNEIRAAIWTKASNGHHKVSEGGNNGPNDRVVVDARSTKHAAGSTGWRSQSAHITCPMGRIRNLKCCLAGQCEGWPRTVDAAVAEIVAVAGAEVEAALGWAGLAWSGAGAVKLMPARKFYKEFNFLRHTKQDG